MRVMIVEDEPPIIRALISMLHQCDDEYEVVCTAKNGKEALEQLEKEQLDVVFTDINMPVMDGLALMEQIHSQYPGLFIVVLSGYPNFEYVKAAIVNGAFDYLLKPLSKANLSELLFRLKTAYQLKIDRQKELWLAQSINKAPSLPSDIEFSEEYFVMLLCAGPPAFTEDITLPGVSFWDEFDLQNVPGEGKSWIFQGETMPERIIIIEASEALNMERRALEVFERVKANGLPVTAAYYRSPAGLTIMSLVLNTLKRFVRSKQQLGGSVIIKVDEIDGFHTALPAFTSTRADRGTAILAEDLLDSISKGLPFESQLSRCLEALEEAKSSHAEVYRVFESVLARYGGEEGDTNETEVRLLVYEAVYHSLTYEELYSNLLSLFETLETPDKQQKTHEVAEKVAEFLNENYTQPINSDMLSKKFSFVPSYISRIFRQHTGYAPNEYITMLRIKAAKNIMRTRPELMIKEIAYMVGYKNPYHFSKTFKKEVGVWPTDFKKDVASEGGAK